MIATAVPVSPVMLATPPAPTPPAGPDLGALGKQFADLAKDLTGSDETLTTMVAERNPVGDGWGPHLSSLAERLQGARDGFVAAKPTEADLVAKLGKDVLKLAEASGSMSIMARQRATLSEGWSAFLDTAIADASAAAKLLTPAEPGTPPNTPPTPPNTPPTPPTTPPAGPKLPPALVSDVQRAVGLVNQSIDRIRTVPVSDHGDASTKDARIAAFNFNMEAQKVLEGHFQGEDAGITSALRSADASLEDANWQLAKKPSPDGRFNGVDIPGALRDSQSAVDALQKLVAPAA
jgi:hypothetical protein